MKHLVSYYSHDETEVYCDAFVRYDNYTHKIDEADCTKCLVQVVALGTLAEARLRRLGWGLN